MLRIAGCTPHKEHLLGDAFVQGIKEREYGTVRNEPESVFALTRNMSAMSWKRCPQSPEYSKSRR